MATGIIALRRRIRSVRNTLKTTAAMQMISSVKMRRAVEAATKSRTFVDEARRLLARIKESGANGHPLLQQRPIKKGLVIVITADKGLAGSYNSDVIKQALTVIKEWQEKGVVVNLITVGRKATAALRSVANTNLLASFEHLSDAIEFSESSPIGQLAMKTYQEGGCDQVKVVYQHYVSTVVQKVRALTLIPLDPADYESEEVKGNPLPVGYVFEPDAESVLAAVVPYLVQMNLWQSLLEARAAEQAARMIAMKNATDAGKELVTDLTFSANQIRQSAITAEIAEIAAGAAAINN